MSSQESKSRSGRFDLPANELVEKFNATIPFEQRVCPFDIKDSTAVASIAEFFHDACAAGHYFRSGCAGHLPRT